MKASIDEIVGSAFATLPPPYGYGACPFIREMLDRVGDKWSVLVLLLLGPESRRFNELRRVIPGISQRMLSQCLRGLERDGLVNRKVYATIPPKVEYSLTSLGQSLLGTLNGLAEWADTHREAIKESRADYDLREEVLEDSE